MSLRFQFSEQAFQYVDVCRDATTANPKHRSVTVTSCVFLSPSSSWNSVYSWVAGSPVVTSCQVLLCAKKSLKEKTKQTTNMDIWTRNPETIWKVSLGAARFIPGTHYFFTRRPWFDPWDRWGIRTATENGHVNFCCWFFLWSWEEEEETYQM